MNYMVVMNELLLSPTLAKFHIFLQLSKTWLPNFNTNKNSNV